MAVSIIRFTRRIISVTERANCLSAITLTKFSTAKQVIDFQPQNTLLPTQHFNGLREYSKTVRQQVQRKKGYASSDSDSDSDNENIKKHHKGESDFWRSKMRTFHSLLDVNKDGVISFDDFKLLSDKFVNLGHLSESQTKEFRHCIKEMWEAQWGEITPYNLVTVEQYLEDMHHVLNDKQLKKKVQNFLPYLFKAVDKDQSGEISVEEFKLFFKCLGVEERHAVVSFTTIDTNKDGRLSIQEFVKLGRNYFLTENQNSISKVFWGPLTEH